MRILHLSDLHICSSADAIIYGVNPYNNLQRAINKIRAIEEKIDMCVITGDISNDGTEESYNLADIALSILPFPIYVTNGNHDSYHNLIGRSHKKLLFQQQVTIQGIDFLFLNSVVVDEDGSNRSRGYLSNDELKLVMRVLGQNHPTIILMHHPVIELGSWLDRRILENRQSFIDIVATSNKVIAVLSGHNHYFSNKAIGGCLYYTAPSISTSYDICLAPFEEAFSPGFNILKITDENRCYIETVRI